MLILSEGLFLADDVFGTVVWQLVQSAVPDAWLLVAGAGGQVFRPSALPEMQRVKFLGFVPDNFLPGLYTNAALFILPSLEEGFGLPVLEAMACGTAVVCTRSGTADFARDGGNALVARWRQPFAPKCC